MRTHLQCVAVDNVLRQHKERDAIQIFRLIEVQIRGEDLQQICAALSHVVRQKLNPINTHEREKRVVPFFKIGFAEFDFNSGEFTLKDSHEEVAAPARRLQEAGVNALGLAFDKVKHRFDHPWGSKYLSVVSDTLL